MIGYLRRIGCGRRLLGVKAGQTQQRRGTGQVGVGGVSQLLNRAAGLTQLVVLAGQPGLDRTGRRREQTASQPGLVLADHCGLGRGVSAMLERIAFTPAVSRAVARLIGRFIVLAAPLGHPRPGVAGVRGIGLPVIRVVGGLSDPSQNG